LKINGEHKVLSPKSADAGGSEPRPDKVRRGARPEDAVEISGSARGVDRLERPAQDAAANRMNATLSQVRARLQERIRTDFYNSEDILENIAGRMLDLFGL
jgi:hypothetical protein